MRTLKEIYKDINEIKETKNELKNSSIPEPDKIKMMEDLDRIMEKLKKEGRESAIFTDEPFFGKAPLKLLRDPKIRLQAKGLYVLMHTYSQPKDLMKDPRTFVSLQTLAKDLGLGRTQTIYWIKYLESTGWLTIKHRGLNCSNWYILHARKKRRNN